MPASAGPSAPGRTIDLDALPGTRTWRTRGRWLQSGLWSAAWKLPVSRFHEGFENRRIVPAGFVEELFLRPILVEPPVRREGMTVIDAEVLSKMPFRRGGMTRPTSVGRGSMGPARDVGDDEALLTRIARSDLEAFQAVYDRYSGPVYSLAWSMLRDASVAQEITQDVFLAIWRGSGAFDVGRGSARSWILSLAHHKSVDAVRKWRRAVTAPLSEGITDDADVVEEALRKVDRAGVRDALRALSPDQREAIVLAYYGGYTQREIADRLRTPLGTVKTRIRDGLLRLREMLGGGVMEETVR